MKLIGLYIFEDTQDVQRRSLAPGWYPFVNAQAPAIRETPTPPRIKSSVPKDFFRIDPDMPEVNISCIVGLNGSGKSSLIELILKIINNFSVTAFGGEGTEELLSQNYVPGITADLYLQIDGDLYCINNVDRGGDDIRREVRLYRFNGNDKPEKINLEQLDYKDSIQVISKLCYNICVNYGLHSFNPNASNSFDANRKGYKPICWFDKVFHRVDDYHLPLTIMPSRNEGVIDINNENKLTKQRMAAISLLLFSKNSKDGKESKDVKDSEVIPIGYRPSYIRYGWIRRSRPYTEKLFERVIGEKPEPDSDLLKLFDPMHAKWEEWMDNNIDRKSLDADVVDNAINYLTLKTLKICMAHYPYVEKIKEYLYQGFEDFPESVDPFEMCGELIEEILANESYVSVKVHGVINFLRSDAYRDKVSGSIDVETLLKDTEVKSYSDIVKLLPPSFYHYECYYSKGGKEDLSIDRMSSGERQFILTFSAVLYHLANLSSIPMNDTHRVPYHHVNLIFDEVELYFHPEYQRGLIWSLLNAISKLGLNKDIIKSINILLATHSPFILSDVPAQNVLYLGKEGNGFPRTFGANIYDSLKDGFFMKGSMGVLVTEKIKSLMEAYYEKDSTEQEKIFLSKKDEFSFIADEVEDEYLKRVLKRFYDCLSAKYDKR